MSGTLIWTDRLRIERAVWTFNSYLQTLPMRSQAAKRRELRINLRAASADVGTEEAVRRLGNVRTMAAEYITAEYGGPRPSWWAAIYVALPAFVLMFWLSNARIDAFKGGVLAANPHASGLFHWHGVAYVFTDATFTFVNGKATEVGGTLLPLVYVCVFGLAILVGRLWRVLPASRRRSAITVGYSPTVTARGRHSSAAPSRASVNDAASSRAVRSSSPS